MKELTFRVYGVPRPGGSKRAFYNKKLGRAMVVDASSKVKSWKQDVKDAALAVAPQVPLACPLSVEVSFLMPRPKGHYGTGRNAAVLKASAPTMHTKMPDVIKLMRGTEDALTGILWKDDAQIWDQGLQKVYDDRPGAMITVRWKES